LGRALDELVADGYAEGHPRPGVGMLPRDGLVWIAPSGRRLVESSQKLSSSPAREGVTPTDFFISRNKADKAWAEWIA
jgi:hypothetical protein